MNALAKRYIIFRLPLLLYSLQLKCLFNAVSKMLSLGKLNAEYYFKTATYNRFIDLCENFYSRAEATTIMAGFSERCFCHLMLKIEVF